MARPYRKPSGFTLIEVLVALAIFGLLLVGLTQATHFGLEAWRRQAGIIAERDQLDAIDRTLRRMLADGIILNNENPNRLTFIGRLPEAVALDTSRADMTLFVDSKNRLILRWTTHRHEKTLGEVPSPTDTPLLAGVAGLKIAYWRAGDTNSPAGWSQDRGGASPGLVKLTLLFPKNDPRRWPDIVVRPWLDAPNGR